MRLRVISTILLFSATAFAGDFPQWRGPLRDGSVKDMQLPSSWPDKLTRKWKIEVGTGHSSPVVAGGKVFHHARQGENEIVRAINPATGKVLWEQSYGAPYTMNSAATTHGKGPKSTPIVADGRVCTLGISGILACFDAATGKPLWRKEFGREFRNTSPLYGTAMSPMMDGDTLIAHVGGDGAGALRAFDAATGKTKWSWNGDGPGYTSPLIFDLGGVRQLVTHSEQKIIGVEPDSGKLLWSIDYRTPYAQNSVTPVLHDGKLILSGLKKPTTLVEVLYNGNSWETKQLWENADATLYMSSPVLRGDLVFGFANRNSGQLFCLDARSGKMHWTGPPRSGKNAALLIAGDTLLILTDDAELTIARATAEHYDLVKQYSVADSPTWAHPVPCGSGLLVKDTTSLALWAWQ